MTDKSSSGIHIEYHSLQPERLVRSRLSSSPTPTVEDCQLPGNPPIQLTPLHASQYSIPVQDPASHA